MSAFFQVFEGFTAFSSSYFNSRSFSRLGLKYIGDQLQAKRLGSEHF
jgi:hypothetical protein